jgi:16S rRNA (guanine(966)-N(2))-methyltransferase RsmD
MSKSSPRPTSRSATRPDSRPSSQPSSRSGHKPAPRPKTPPGEIRIIGGQWKRTRLAVPDKPGLRPTPDRVRETLFNWLGQDLSGWRCVDAFAGTGALGLEAASRGAAQVTLFESDAALAAALLQARDRLGAAAVRVERGDGVTGLRRLAPASVDLVFLDPPFDSALFAPALEAARSALADGGFIYLEAPAAMTAEAAAGQGLEVHRHLKAGAVHAHLLRRAS